MPKRGKSFEGKLPKSNNKTISAKCPLCKKHVDNIGSHNKVKHKVTKP